MNTKTVVIIGAGPAGLTAAYQLLKNIGYKVIIIEANNQVGGLSRSEIYKGYKIDIGPHRFFSKSERVNNFWKEILPLVNTGNSQGNYWLSINRLTRILFSKKLFKYPIGLSIDTIKKLGVKRMLSVLISYVFSRFVPINPEKNLEDFLINRFGSELYKTFFKDYTKKVWGRDCQQIPQQWGEQRIKGISISKIITNAIKDIFNKNNKGKESSLINNFLYPRFGAGSVYREAANLIIQKNGQIILNSKVIGLEIKNSSDDLNSNVVSIQNDNNRITKIECDYVISSMPIKDLFNCLSKVPDSVLEISNNLVHRDYIIVGLLLDRMNCQKGCLPDNWIYIQEKDWKMGRLDIFNNFSISLLQDNERVWLGAEYFCDKNDDVWLMTDEELKELAYNELVNMNLIKPGSLQDGVVIRQEKAYPAYFGSYNKMDILIKYLENYPSLSLIGRNGQHKYNNMDHSILSAMVAVDNIIGGVKNKNNIWEVNTEQEYHEQKTD